VIIPPKIAFWLLLLVLVLPGLAGVIVFGHYAFVDWKALQEAYHFYQRVALSDSDMRQLYVAETDQNIHRINLFANGVWALLSAILGAVGLVGICGRRAAKD